MTEEALRAQLIASKQTACANLGLIAAELKSGSKVAISGFGTFEARERKERTGRNPHTGEAVNIPATRAPAFKAGKPLKESLRG